MAKSVSRKSLKTRFIGILPVDAEPTLLDEEVMLTVVSGKD